MQLSLILLLSVFSVLLLTIYFFFPLSKTELDTVALMPEAEWRRPRFRHFKSKGFRLWRLRQILQETGDLILIRRVLEDENGVELARFNQLGPYSADSEFKLNKFVWIAANGSLVHPRPTNASQGNTLVILKNEEIWTEAMPSRAGGQLGYKVTLGNFAYEIRWDKKWIRHFSRSGEIWLGSNLVGIFEDTQLEAGAMPRILLAFDETQLPLEHRVGIFGLITIGLYDGMMFGKNVTDP